MDLRPKPRDFKLEAIAEAARWRVWQVDWRDLIC
jgi:hypothetical protein